MIRALGREPADDGGHVLLGRRPACADPVEHVEAEFGMARIEDPLCCTGRNRGRTGPYPVRGQAVRTYFGRPNSSMRFRTWTATSISVARRSSVRERSPSPITRLNRPMVASARARAL